MKILVTGANGNLAKVVAEKLTEKSISFVTCSSKPKGDQIYFDLHSELNENIFDEITYIIHFATSPIYQVSNTEIQFLSLAAKKKYQIDLFWKYKLLSERKNQLRSI
jgi:nucleoside-diphosphate-sugar epimerase